MDINRLQNLAGCKGVDMMRSRRCCRQNKVLEARPVRTSNEVYFSADKVARLRIPSIPVLIQIAGNSVGGRMKIVV